MSLSESNYAHFTPLQSRKLPCSISHSNTRNMVSICPSMDLIALGLSSSSSSSSSPPSTAHSSSDNHEDGTGGTDVFAGGAETVVVHRILSWKKLLSVNESDFASVEASTATSSLVLDLSRNKNTLQKSMTSSPSSASTVELGASSLCWSPDGRAIAIGLTDGSICIYVVEDGDGSEVAHLISPLPPFQITTPSDSDNKEEYDGGDSIDNSSNSNSPVLTRSKRAAATAAAVIHKSTTKTSHQTSVSYDKSFEEDKIHNEKIKEKEDDKETNQSYPSYIPSIISIVWSKFASHPENEYYDENNHLYNEELVWRVQNRYLDRAYHFLPHIQPSFYSSSDNKDSLLLSAAFMRDKDEDNTCFDSIDSFLTDPIASITQPSCKTNMSVLVALEKNGRLALYLHGRFLICEILPTQQHDNDNTDSKIISTSDLSTLLVSSTLSTSSSYNTNMLTMYSLPSLSKHQYTLSQLSSSYCFITTQLNGIQKEMKTVRMKWKESFRILNAKLGALRGLFGSYGVYDNKKIGKEDGKAETSKNVPASPKSEILSYLFLGRSSCFSLHDNTYDGAGASASASTEAVTNFFATHLNEMGLTRMKNSCELGLASIETLIRRNILASVRALLYAANELNGLASTARAVDSYATLSFNEEMKRDTIVDYQGEEEHAQESKDDDNENNNVLISYTQTIELQKSCESLYLTVEYCLSHIVIIRHRLRDFLCWMSYMHANMKAQGTALDSFERENARKKKPPKVVINSLVSFLSEEEEAEEVKNDDTTMKRTESELLFGIPILDFFDQDNVKVQKKSSSIYSSDEKDESSDIMASDIPSIKALVKSITNICQSLFSQPCDRLSKTVRRRNVFIEKDHDKCCNSIATHKRMGLYHSESNNSCGFRPRIVNLHNSVDNDEEINDKFHSREWFLVAKSSQAEMEKEEESFDEHLKHNENNMVRLFAFPCCAEYDDEEKDDDGYTTSTTEKNQFHYLEGLMKLPKGCQVKEIVFYGDDGKSSLWDNDNYDHDYKNAFDTSLGSSSEGRQALVLLVSREQNNNNTISEELWMIRDYDKIGFRLIQCHSLDENGDNRSNNDVNIERYDKAIAMEHNSADLISDIVIIDREDDEEDSEEEQEYDDYDTSQKKKVKMYARTRQVRTIEKISEKEAVKEFSTRQRTSNCLVVSGSRGIGGVMLNNNKDIIRLFDLEENEASDDSDEGDNSYMDEE